MTLTLMVGLRADLLRREPEIAEQLAAEFAEINALLEKNGLAPHLEPDECEVWSVDMPSFSSLHYLRRLAANVHLKGELPTPGDETNLDDDEPTDRYYELASETGGFLSNLLGVKTPSDRPFDQLIVHRDNDGFYVPIDFPEPIPYESRASGPGWIGSSIALERECEKLIEALGLPADIDLDGVVQTGEESETWQRYATESFCVVALREACRRAARTGAALVFVG